MFTPRRVSGLEPKIREFCATTLDPDGRHREASTSSSDLGAYMPMRTIGMLLGIPEADQEALRETIDKGLELESAEMPDMLERMAERPGAGPRCSGTTSTGGSRTRPTTS